MSRIAWCLSLITFTCLGILDGAEPLPKDTLPAKLSIQAIPLGLDKDLNIAMQLAARNAIKFLASRGGMTELDAYGLCSIAASFRVTQVVDIVRGVHVMIPKSLFSGDLRQKIAVV